ncbi:uncharacterized protein [Parasteatoda tepidariorum]|uniref:uncharacterized protein n=1 Tax=Parasteatoda tepidariorum TaxID=114398 RepID=UPI00077F8CB3|nr:uncharacterized protein LOC107440815 [Parasteatoda tepidariorum]XP_015909354.1 uncharacterized protein LOC107440815 [Parasteatoda tepidariorum]
MSGEGNDSTIDQRKTVGIKKDGFIEYTLREPPSLLSLMLISIAIKLWTEPDLKKDVQRHSLKHGSKIRSTEEKLSYQRLEERVFAKVDGLLLSVSLKHEIYSVIRPIGLELIGAFVRRRNFQNCLNGNELDTTLYWTVEGTVDEVELIKEVLKTTERDGLRISDIQGIYLLACEFCLEEYISDIFISIYKLQELLEMMNQADADGIYSESYCINQNIISVAIFRGKIHSFLYFWEKLTDTQKTRGLDHWFDILMNKTVMAESQYCYLEYNGHTDIMCSMLSRLNGKKQKKYFLKYSFRILKSLLFSWPFQKYLLPTITSMMEYLQEDVYVKIMATIGDLVGESKTFETKNLFIKIWSISDLRLKKSLLRDLYERQRAAWDLMEKINNKTLDYDTQLSLKPSVELHCKRQKTLWNLLKLCNDRTIDLIINDIFSEGIRKVDFR